MGVGATRGLPAGCSGIRRFASKVQAPRSGSRPPGRGRFDPETGKNEYRQEHDYTVGPRTYTYSAEVNQELFERFPLVTSKNLAQRPQRPRKVRMLARDFIDDSLYNPAYGYFSKSAEIYSQSVPFDYQNIQNIDGFLDAWTKDYEATIKGSANDPHARKKALSRSEPNRSQAMARNTRQRLADASNVKESQVIEQDSNSQRLRQLWHTPSELFHPFYGQTLARYMLKTFLERQTSGEDPLLIYEMGAGNGTLMIDIMDYIRDYHPEVYARTSYSVIEISPSLAIKQRSNSSGHGEKIQIINKSIFDYDKLEDQQCFFLALEVWDNFSHDVIRYDNTTNQPNQGYVVVQPDGNFVQIFSPKLDRWAKKFLDLRGSFKNFKPDWKLGVHPLSLPRRVRQLKNSIIPFHGSLSGEDYIPTKYLEFLYVLKEKFPKHHLIGSDFTHFSERVPGYSSPVVQTFIDGVPVPISTFMAIQGYFDIMFPTDFRLAQQLYEAVCGQKANVTQHGTFLASYAKEAATATKTGENPMLAFYRNAAFLTSGAGINS